MKRRFMAACLLTAMLLIALPSSGLAAAPAGVCFTAANDQLMELNSENMPFYSNNVLYVSSRLFEATDLGVAYVRSTSLGVAMLYNSTTDLRFDLAGQVAYDKQGNFYSGYAIEQGGVIFFPLNLVCRQFGLTWSYTETDIAPLIRVKSGSAVLSDAVFIDAAASLMQDRYADYERAIAAVPPAPEPPPEPPPAQAVEGQKIYLLLSARSSESAFAAMDALEDVQATFLLTVEQMQDGNLLRALASQGHATALRIQSEAPEDALWELETGRDLLWQAACLWLDLAWYEGGADLEALLDDQGCLRISAAVDPPAANQSNTNRIAALLRSIGRFRTDIGVYLGDAGDCRSLIPGLLSELEEGGYRVSAWRLNADGGARER